MSNGGSHVRSWLLWCRALTVCSSVNSLFPPPRCVEKLSPRTEHSAWTTREKERADNLVISKDSLSTLSRETNMFWQTLLTPVLTYFLKTQKFISEGMQLPACGKGTRHLFCPASRLLHCSRIQGIYLLLPPPTPFFWRKVFFWHWHDNLPAWDSKCCVLCDACLDEAFDSISYSLVPLLLTLTEQAPSREQAFPQAMWLMAGSTTALASKITGWLWCR